MAGVITTGSFPKLLWPGLNAIWGAEYAMYANGAEWKELFNVEASEKAYEETVSVTGLGLASVLTEGSALKYDTMKQAYVTRYTNTTYALGFVITRNELQDNLYAEAGRKRAKALAFSMNQTKEIVGANIFDRAFNAASPGGDGVSMINASHPTEGGTQSNTLTIAADLSEASLENAINDIALFRDNRNNRIAVIPSKLAVPVNLQFDAIRILQNPNRPGTAERDINAIYAQGYFTDGLRVNHYFTDTDAWFILTNCPDGLRHFIREAPIFDTDNEFDTKNAKYSGLERYSFGWDDWRSVYGSPGA